ncbi:MAG: thioredoxin reductase [Phycisphaerales bacterium]|nr:thioredoxin reductase [Phycisphaerales bacterium]MDB5355074.1 thioredoxin reductase [Phycisphaerales bacterium]
MAEQDLHSAAFARLDEAHMDSLARCVGAPLTRHKDGQKLIEAGDRDFRFFVIKSGRIAIQDDSETPNTIAVLEPGQFTGEVTHLTGGPSPVSAVAQGDVDAYEVSADGLREIINRFPNVGDIVMQAFIARREILRECDEFDGLSVIGSRYSKDTFRIRVFLAENQILFRWLDLEADPHVAQLLKQFGVDEADTPVVRWSRRFLLRNPSNRELAETLGIRQPLKQTAYDLVVVGAGPAGLAAAVYGASEGLSTVLLESAGPGGQAGRSMRIENYLGFPTGITGGELAERAVLQAGKFGARLLVATQVAGLTFENAYAQLHLDGGETVLGKCLLIATGAEYRRLDAAGRERFEGCGVFYAATPVEAPICRGAEVVVVGGGNSAGQAAVYLAGIARKVDLVIRADNLYKDMSAYLARRIEETANIEILLNTVVQRMLGNGHLGAIELVDNKTGQTRTINTPALFSFIGAAPRSDWLPPEIEKDAKQFVRTGPTLAQSSHWNARRQPFLLETSHPGVFASGDVRAGSTKRVASAVGEGAMAVQFVHEYLKEM